MADPSPTSTPPLGRSLGRGLRGRCPACGNAPLFGRFLKPVSACDACGCDWTLQAADDFPAYLVVLLLGHLIIPIVVETNLHFDLAATVQMILWPSMISVLALLLIQPMKGFVIALIWAR